MAYDYEQGRSGDSDSGNNETEHPTENSGKGHCEYWLPRYGTNSAHPTESGRIIVGTELRCSPKGDEGSLKAKKFEFSTVEDLTKGLGLQLTRTKNELFISEPNYIQFIMDEFDIQPITKSTPITKWFESRREDELPLDSEAKTRFQSLLGALSHLARMTRPEALLAVFHTF